MELITSLIDFILHIDEYLSVLISTYGAWTYGILFLIVFAETGLVVTPFLPGDSLIFAAATFAARGVLNPWALFFVITAAGVIGDGVNYAVGHYIGPRVFSENIRFLKKEYLNRAHDFFEKYGGKAIVLARFVPIVRTFVPFVAGVGSMTYPRFVMFNVTGAVLWVGLFTFLGYFFGNIPAVEQNFTYVIFGIIFLSILPPIIEYFRERGRMAKERAEA